MTRQPLACNLGRRRPTNRRGISLIEVVAAATIGSLITGLAVTALVLAIKNSDAAHHDLAARSELNRLARQFRRDVHAARQATFEPAPELVTLSDATRLIRYRRNGNTIERSEELIASGAPANGQPPTRERFRLAPGSVSAIEGVPSGATSLLRLRIARAPAVDAPAAAPRVSQAAESGQSHDIDAWLGRDFRGAGVVITGTPGTSPAPSAAVSTSTDASTIAIAQPTETTP